MNILLVTCPGALRDSLSALFSATPEVEVVSVTNDCNTALEYIFEHHPNICIIDLNSLDDNQLCSIKEINSAGPKIKTVALVGEVESKNLTQSLGFDEVIIKGTPVDKLIDAIIGVDHGTSVTNKRSDP